MMLSWALAAAVDPSPVSVLVTPPVEEPLTLEQAKARAGFDWISPDPRDALLMDFLRAARAQVEHDTGLALLTQTRDAWLNAFPLTATGLIRLPSQCRPLQSVTTVGFIDATGVAIVLPAEAYVVDLARGEIGLAPGATWPAFSTLRGVAPITIRVVAGWPDADILAQHAPLLVQAVGLLTAHYATAGRDLASGDGLEATPLGYAAAIAPYEQVSVF